MAPAGSDTFAITIYDGASGSGTVLGGGTGSTTVTNGQPFTVTIAVNPVVASLTSPVFVFSSGSSFTVGTAGTASLTFTALDPDHNSIAPSSTSAFASPVQLVSSDPHVAVSPASWTSPTQPITLTYDGSTAVGTTVTVSAKIASVSIGSATTSTAFAYVVSTFAGTGAAGSTNGTNLSATFNGPVGLTLDTSGNLIVSERSGDDVRKISGGIVSTVSGTGALGSLDGPALTATYNIPNALAFDAVGNLYVADIYNDKIRKLSTAGIVTTYAGTGAPGAMNGAAASATFFQPQGLAIDAGGDLFIADLGNNAIREISAAGIVSTFAGSGAVGSMDGPAATATFNMPSGIAVDSAGTVYVTDTSNHKIRKIAGGVVSTLAGTGATSPVVNGPGATATFFHPQGIAVDAAGDLLVSDQFNNLIRKITPAGVVSTVAGTGSAGSMDGPGFSATLNQPTGIVVSPSGMIYVADYANNKIRVITP
jgi:sugar lactone lactonase YvrE